MNKKMLNQDTNVMLVALAIQCMTGLAKGLRNHCKNAANNMLSTLLEKFKVFQINPYHIVQKCRVAPDTDLVGYPAAGYPTKKICWISG